MTLLSSEPVYRGRIISLDLDTVRFPDGSTGVLEMVRHPGAAAVLPFLDPPDAADPRVILIRQFRWAAGGESLWEVPAGRLDAGALDARELAEPSGAPAPEPGELSAFYEAWGWALDSPGLWLACPAGVRMAHAALSGSGHWPALGLAAAREHGARLGSRAVRDALLPALGGISVGLKSWAWAAAGRDAGALPRDATRGAPGFRHDPLDEERRAGRALAFAARQEQAARWAEEHQRGKVERWCSDLVARAAASSAPEPTAAEEAAPPPRPEWRVVRLAAAPAGDGSEWLLEAHARLEPPGAPPERQWWVHRPAGDSAAPDPGWAVTHPPTGLSVASGWSLAAALELAAELDPRWSEERLESAVGEHQHARVWRAVGGGPARRRARRVGTWDGPPARDFGLYDRRGRLRWAHAVELAEGGRLRAAGELARLELRLHVGPEPARRPRPLAIDEAPPPDLGPARVRLARLDEAEARAAARDAVRAGRSAWAEVRGLALGPAGDVVAEWSLGRYEVAP